MWSRDGQVKPDHPTGPNSFPMRLCLRLDGWYSEAFKPRRSRGDPAPSLQKPGRRRRTNHTQLWSERLEKKDVEHAGESSRGKGQEEDRGLGKKTLIRRPKGNVQISRHALKDKIDNQTHPPPSRGRNSAGSMGSTKFLRNTENFTIDHANQGLQGKDRVKG